MGKAQQTISFFLPKEEHSLQAAENQEEEAMPSMYVVGKSVLSLMAFPGCMMAAVGAGVLPVDAEMAQFPPFW